MRCENCGHENVEEARFCADCGALLPLAGGGDDPLIGQVVGGRHRIKRVLGEGGMGIVYEAEQQMGSALRPVAVKTLHSHLSKDPNVRERFNRECGIVAQLDHANTVRIYDFGDLPDGTLYIAMEFVKGHALADLLQECGPLSTERVLKIMKQICGALDEAHELGIVHRDLKPENVILGDRAGESDFVKVLDFGIAARTESADAKKEQKLTQQGMVLGTPPYMSPEQFTGKELDRRSDIYSLGVMAYEMLTGRLPFDAETPWEWATQHMTASPTPFEASAPSAAIPAGVRQAILRALAKNRDERQGTAKEFFADLSRGFGAHATAVTSPQPMMAASPQPVAGTAAMPALPLSVTGAAAVHAPPPAAVAQYVPGPPVAPHPAAAARSNLLLIVVGGAVGVLALAIGVVVFLQMRPRGGDEELVLTDPFASGDSEGDPAPDASPDNATGVDAGEVGQAPASASAGQGQAGDADVAPEAGAPTASSSAGQAVAGGTNTEPAGGGAASSCQLCIQAASQGNAAAARGHYDRCNEAAKKARCSSALAGSVQPRVNQAAASGQCDKARNMAAQASRMGAAVTVPGSCRVGKRR